MFQNNPKSNPIMKQMKQNHNQLAPTLLAAFFAAPLALFLSSQASAQTTVVASADNLVVSNSPTTIQNSAGAVRTKASPERLGMFKFDLTNPDGSASALVEFAVFDADTTSADSYSGSFWALDAGWTATGSKLGTDWDETAIHYSNAPGMSTTTDGPDSSAMTQLGTFSVTGGTTPTFDVSISLLSDFLQSDNTVTIAIFTSSQSGTGDNWLDWFSSETGSATTAPQLTYTVVPEPSSFGLLAGMLGLTWVMLRRRG